MNPLSVTVVRPKFSGAESFGTFLGSLVGLLFRAWIFMLVAPALSFTPGYGQSILVVVAASMLFNWSDYTLWTKAPRR